MQRSRRAPRALRAQRVDAERASRPGWGHFVAPGRGLSLDQVARAAARTIAGMTSSSTRFGTRTEPWWAPVFAGLRGVSWQTLALILAINTAVAAILYIEETRAFWHPFVTAQCFGLSIAYMVNAAS